MITSKESLQAFFLPAEPGTRFALFHPAHGKAPRGGILFAHALAEEMNKSRRMAAIQARAFALAGYSVLQADLYGCGDSSGDFGDARWEIWKRDVELATAWLNRHVSGPIHLWGLRLGATLALACWQDMPDRYASALLWQPVVDGESCVTQFLRLAVARNALREGGRKVTTDMLRASLASGQSVEVAGYELAPSLAAAIDGQRLVNWSVPGAAVNWLDVRTTAPSVPPPVQKTLDAWCAKDVEVTYRAVAGQPFWSSLEIIEVADLISTTTAMYTERHS